MDAEIAASIFEMLKFALPALLCIGTAYLIFRQQIEKEEARAQKEIRVQAFSSFFPLQLSAYERAILFLERIRPDALLSRIGAQQKSAGYLASEILGEIQSEYEHNIVQQLYISEDGWNALQSAKEEVVDLVRVAGARLHDKATGGELSNLIYKFLQEREQPLLCDSAINRLKRDMIEKF